MKTILVSGASGIIGYGILRNLRRLDKELILVGTSIHTDSPAEVFSNIFEKAIPTNDKEYLKWLLTIIEKHKIDMIIPGIEADMYQWNEYRPQIGNSGVKMLLNNADLIALCYDKWAFYELLYKQKTSYAIDTTLENEYDYLVNRFGNSFLLKPRIGHGSKGIIRINNKDLFNKHQQEIGTILMAQPIVGNEEEEFSTSAFCDGQGGYYALMSLRRKLSKDGFTEKAQVVELIEIEEAVADLCKIFKPLGPTNFQFRKHEGVFKLLEINPRISSATSIRASFGYNEANMAIDYMLEGKEITQPKIRRGKSYRYIEDFIIYE